MATAADILTPSRPPKIPARWAAYYKELCAERDRLMARDFSGQSVSLAKVDDLGDAASEESDRCLSLVASAATQDIIFEVLGAIRRIEKGTYGVCEITGQPIETERLKAVPWSRYSLEGQHELERTGQSRRTALPGLTTVNEPQAGSDDEEEDDSN